MGDSDSVGEPHFYVAQPLHNAAIDPASRDAVWKGTTRKVVLPRASSNSLLANNFNRHWVEALKKFKEGVVTHFVMLHGDVIPEDGWMDVMHAEMVEHDLDILSAVVPIKSEKGVTSTAIGYPDRPWGVWKRLTMREVYALPETFGAEHTEQPGWPLLVNTGCMMIRLSPEWPFYYTESEGLEFRFEIRDWIIPKPPDTPDGEVKLECCVQPEDWGFSRKAWRRGLRVMATRKVALSHIGASSYPNTSAWGTVATEAPPPE